LSSQDLDFRVDCFLREAELKAPPPIERLSEAYRILAPHYSDESWKQIREKVARMEEIEDEILSPKFALRESAYRSRLFEEYDRVTELKDYVLRERGYADLSDEDRELYDRYRGESGLFRTKDSYKQRMRKLKKLDAERAKARAEMGPIEEREPEEEVIEDLETDLEVLASEAKAQPEKRTPLYKKALSKLKVAATKIGEIDKSFSAKHPKISKLLKAIAVPVAGAIGGLFKYYLNPLNPMAAIFRPFGPVGIVFSMACGVLVAYAAKLGAKAGQSSAQALIAFCKKVAASSKRPLTKKIFTALASPKGQVVITVVLSIAGGMAGGLAANAAVMKFGPQLASGFTQLFGPKAEALEVEVAEVIDPIEESGGSVEEAQEAIGQEVVEDVKEAAPEVETLEQPAVTQPQAQSIQEAPIQEQPQAKPIQPTDPSPADPAPQARIANQTAAAAQTTQSLEQMGFQSGKVTVDGKSYLGYMKEVPAADGTTNRIMILDYDGTGTFSSNDQAIVQVVQNGQVIDSSSVPLNQTEVGQQLIASNQNFARPAPPPPPRIPLTKVGDGVFMTEAGELITHAGDGNYLIQVPNPTGDIPMRVVLNSDGTAHIIANFSGKQPAEILKRAWQIAKSLPT
jgi:hypothetical protein